MVYTFGDSEEASRRLRLLAEVYEPETRELLLRARKFSSTGQKQLAVDMGCGPGWTTQLLHALWNAKRTVGLEVSERYLVEAKRQNSECEFFMHDIQKTPFPVEAPNLIFCRFLLAHLTEPEKVLQRWAQVAAPGAFLVIHETEAIRSLHPVMQNYYAMVEQMQHNYGQNLYVGEKLDECLCGSGWKVLESISVCLEKPAQTMAQLHLPNLRAWRSNDYVFQAFHTGDVDNLENSLEKIASGTEEGGHVYNVARQIIAVRE